VHQLIKLVACAAGINYADLPKNDHHDLGQNEVASRFSMVSSAHLRHVPGGLLALCRESHPRQKKSSVLDFMLLYAFAAFITV
jgi:hypothetical protein